MERPQYEKGYLALNETTLLAEQGDVQFQADVLLNKLADLARKAELSWNERFSLLRGIGELRGYVHKQSRRVLSEAAGRCN